MLQTKRFLAWLIVLIWALAGCRAAPSVAPSVAGSAAVVPVVVPVVGVEAVAVPHDKPEEITIAFLGPLTGGAAFIGDEILGFAAAVADLYSEEWGITINIVQGDTEINPDTGTIVAEQFVANDAIIGVIGPVGSQVCAATQPIFAEAGLAHVTPSCTATALTQPGTPTFFRPIPTDAAQSQTIAAYLLETLDVGAVFVLDDQSSYSVSLGDEVEALLAEEGVRVERASAAQEESDFSALVTSMIAAKMDAVLFPSQIPSQQSTLAVQLREQGYEGIYFLGDGGFTLDWVASAGEAAEGAYITFFAPDPNLVPEAAAMNARFTEMTGITDFGAFGGAGGLSAQVLLEAVGLCIEAGDVSRPCVVEALNTLALDNTVLGIPLAFGEGNQAAGGFSLFQVQDGAFVLLE